jgi:hypothetical protein
MTKNSRISHSWQDRDNELLNLLICSFVTVENQERHLYDPPEEFPRDEVKYCKI